MNVSMNKIPYPPSISDLFRRLPGIVMLLFLLQVTIPGRLSGQELSNIGKVQPVTIDGGISVNQVYSHSDAANNYRKPFAYTLAANLNISIYGWSIPLSAVYSNQNWGYQQPFNQLAIHPSYKWIKTHIGYASMSFSGYTLSGHQFFGGGVELTPAGNWKFSAMAGRMQKRVIPDSSGSITPVYYRFGSGFKTEYTFAKGNLGVSIFYAKDDPRSLTGFDSLKVTPQKNLAIGIDGNFTLPGNMALNFEYGTSLLTDDNRLPSNGEKFAMMPFYRRNPSAHQRHAFKTMYSYNSPVGSIGVGVERVAPGYQTLGAYYMNNDFINYTFNYSGKALKDAINVSVSSGLQKDNLDNLKAQETKRLVNSVTLGIMPSKTVNLNLMYSNFSNYTHVSTGFEDINTTSPYGNIDTLDYTQISQTAGAAFNYSPVATEKFRQNFNLSSSYQLAAERQTDRPDHSGSRFFSGLAGYSCNFVKSNFTLATNFNFSRSKADSMITVLLGPTVTTRKAFFDKKLNVSASLSYNNTYSNGKTQSGVWISRIGTGYTILQHSFDLSAVYANRSNVVKNTVTNEVTLTFTYRYSFSMFKKKETTPSEQINNQQ